MNTIAVIIAIVAGLAVLVFLLMRASVRQGRDELAKEIHEAEEQHEEIAKEVHEEVRSLDDDSLRSELSKWVRKPPSK